MNVASIVLDHGRRGCHKNSDLNRPRLGPHARAGLSADFRRRATTQAAVRPLCGVPLSLKHGGAVRSRERRQVKFSRHRQPEEANSGFYGSNVALSRYPSSSRA